jgi:hypothetical protein
MLSLLANLNPTRGVYTCVSTSSNGGSPLIGQVRHNHGERSARLTFIMPESAFTLPQIQDLLTDLTRFAAGRGAFHLLAEAEENSQTFEQFRRFGFSVYAWQQVWQFTPPSTDRECGQCRWQVASADDEADIHWLYAALVPPLAQAANTPPSHPPRGLIYRKSENMVAFVEVINGIHGIFLEPLIHPETEDVSDLISELINHFPAQSGRPVYVAVRSYQSWLEPFIAKTGMNNSARQALLVKHFTVQQKVVYETNRLAQQAKQTLPLVQHITTKEKSLSSRQHHKNNRLSGTGSEIL